MAKPNPGVGKLLGAMRKLVSEVNDQEICRRLEILQGSEKEDLSASIVKRLLETPDDFDPREVQEPYTQYVKHYLYMVKREARERAREKKSPPSAAPSRTRPDATRASAAQRARKAPEKKGRAAPARPRKPSGSSGGSQEPSSETSSPTPQDA